MIQREAYMKHLVAFQDKPVIKVVTGMRRTGKSVLLALYRDHLLAQGIPSDRIHLVNFESMAFADGMTYLELYERVRNWMQTPGRHYLLLDEIQQVSGWERAVNSFRVDFDVDLTLTGSNAALLSSELSTLLSGRYVEIRMFPLSFREYLDFVGDPGPAGRMAAFGRYLQYGGLPLVPSLPDEPEIVRSYLAGIYHTVIVKDVIQRNQVRDGALLERLMVYMAETIGNPVSVKKISDTLCSFGHRTTVDTIDQYLGLLEKAYILYRADRYDTRGKSLLKTQAKYYIVDTGIRNELLGFGRSDFGRVYENLVYFELLRRGYRVTVGKVDNLEVDFIASRMDRTAYFQVTASLADDQAMEREIRPLLDLRDNYDKTILCLDTFPHAAQDRGIRLKNLLDFLLEPESDASSP